MERYLLKFRYKTFQGNRLDTVLIKYDMFFFSCSYYSLRGLAILQIIDAPCYSIMSTTVVAEINIGFSDLDCNSLKFKISTLHAELGGVFPFLE